MNKYILNCGQVLITNENNILVKEFLAKGSVMLNWTKDSQTKSFTDISLY